jgi:hypothetical protein
MWILNHCMRQARLAQARDERVVFFHHPHILYVPHHLEKISLRIVPYSRRATVKIGGAEVDYSTHLSPGILVRGDHQMVEVTVEAEDGRQGTYRIHIVRLISMPPPPPPPSPAPPHPPSGDPVRFEAYRKETRRDYKAWRQGKYDKKGKCLWGKCMKDDK